MRRSIRWLDRCIKTVNEANKENTVRRVPSSKDDIPHSKLDEDSTQIIFPIIQGGLCKNLRMESITEILKRSPKGLAIGRLSGGRKRRSLPGRFIAVSKIFLDCVRPMRTVRFGRAFSDTAV
jgi:queuine tRNA-ribosyltransferase